MSTLGPNDLKQYALPTYWDAGKLSQVALESGETYEQLISDIAAGLAMVNGELLRDPLYSGMISLTTDLMSEYAVGVSNGFEVHTEYGLPDTKRGKTSGHMNDLISYDRGMGWTWDFLRKARRPQIDADIASAVKDVRDLWGQQILTRHFKNTYTAVGTGRSMPYADAGTADSNYVPVNVPDRATAFASSHDHFEDLVGITQANLETAVKHLWEHGYNGPFELLVADADRSSWTDATALTGYVPVADPLIRYGSTQDLAGTDAEGVIGVIETDYGACRLRSTARIPTGFWTVYKSWGAMDQRNPLVVRYQTQFGIGAVLMAGDHIRQYPLENSIMFAEFGVNVMERIAAVCVENTSGSYSAPTIS